MSKLLDILQAYGCCELKTTLERFLKDEDFYLDILKRVLEDDGFARLGCELRENNCEAAFDTAHMLKGILANCGITPMCELIVQIVEPLRKNEPCDLIPLYEQLMSEKDRLAAALNRL